MNFCVCWFLQMHEKKTKINDHSHKNSFWFLRSFIIVFFRLDLAVALFLFAQNFFSLSLSEM